MTGGPPMASTADTIEPEVAHARAAGLSYVTDAGPGIRRKRAGTGFNYCSPDGKLISDCEVISRIKALAVPPAWTEVGFARRPTGTFRRRVAMREAANNTAIMPIGEMCGT